MPEAQPTNPKIEELRARLQADAGSRLFYPLAEELRKVSRLEDAEQVLRQGLQTHPTYLSAWISLGRVLKERERHHEALEVLRKALTLDQGNVVAAKLAAQSYLAIGEKVEAIKKFKLVQALMPADEEIEETIARLDREINPEKFASPETVSAIPEPPSMPVEEAVGDRTETQPFGELFGESAGRGQEDLPQNEPLGELLETSLESAEEMAQEPAQTPIVEAVPVRGEHGAAVAAPENVFSESDGDEQPPMQTDPATTTLAELYERQGHVDAAIGIYERILEREPENRQVAERLQGLAASHRPAVEKLGGNRRTIQKLKAWREKVTRT